MSSSEHIDDLAELYALGSLEEAELAAVDEHARSCRDCAQRLGEAEGAVAQLVSERAPSSQLDRRVHASLARDSRPSRRWMPLVAAAFIVGLLPSLGFWMGGRESRGSDADRQSAIRAMVSSHFAHSPFTPLQPDSPKAKILYARGAPWVYVLAQTRRPLALGAQLHGVVRPLGALHVDGDTAELFLADVPAVQAFVLLDGSRVIARAVVTQRR